VVNTEFCLQGVYTAGSQSNTSLSI